MYVVIFSLAKICGYCQISFVFSFYKTCVSVISTYLVTDSRYEIEYVIFHIIDATVSYCTPTVCCNEYSTNL